jgi:hypothetical protein
MSYTDKERSDDYKIVFGTPTGRKVLTDILNKGNVFAPIVATDPVAAANMEGARHLALHIASFIKFDADRFIDTWKAPEEAD